MDNRQSDNGDIPYRHSIDVASIPQHQNGRLYRIATNQQQPVVVPVRPHPGHVYYPQQQPQPYLQRYYPIAQDITHSPIHMTAPPPPPQQQMAPQLVQYRHPQIIHRPSVPQIQITHRPILNHRQSIPVLFQSHNPAVVPSSNSPTILHQPQIVPASISPNIPTAIPSNRASIQAQTTQQTNLVRQPHHIMFNTANNQFVRAPSVSMQPQPLHQRPASLLLPARKQSVPIPVSLPIRFSSFQRIDSAFLSKVAGYFRDHVVLNTEIIDDIEYRDCFTGKHAIDILSELVFRRDRSLAMVLGRALEAQFFFHDVNWHFKLLDDKRKLYEFDASTLFKQDTQQNNLPSGIFTMLTKCYAPTCSGQGCYSSSCPFKQSQMNLLRQQSITLLEHSDDVLVDKTQIEESSSAYWSSFAPKDLVASMSKEEITKQEVIYELIQSEKNYVYGLEVVFETFRDAIRKRNIIEPSRREEFLSNLLINRQQLLSMHRKLYARLLQKQKDSFVVKDIAAVFLNQIKDFAQYVEYGKDEPYARWIFTEERDANKAFAEFLEEFQRDPKNKRAEFDHYLRLPSTRFAGYRLQLDRILKYTPVTDAEHALLSDLLHELTEIGKKSNIEGGKTVDHIKLLQFQKSTELTGSEAKLLNLAKPGRQIVRSGTLAIKKVATDMVVDYTLFDHALVFLSRKKAERRKVYKRIYPLALIKLDDMPQVQMLDIQSTHTAASSSPSGAFSNLHTLSSNAATPTSANSNQTHTPVSLYNNSKDEHAGSSPTVVSEESGSINSYVPPPVPSTKEGKFTVHLQIVGPEKTHYNLQFKTDAEKVSWQKAVQKQKDILESENSFFTAKQVSGIQLDFRVHATVSFGDYLFLGCDRGILAVTETTDEIVIRPVLEINKVSHLYVVEEMRCMLALSDRTLYAFDIDILLSTESNGFKLGQSEKISTGVAFFEVGFVYDKPILCSVKNGSLDSRIKMYEPRESRIEKKRGFGLKGSSFSMWNYFEELYIPSLASSLQFLKNRLCIACTKGYEIVDLNTLQSQSLLDMTDDRLKNITSRDNCKSMSLFKVSDGKFLLCYNMFGFFVDQYGRCHSSEYMTWQGDPQKFVYQSPYLLCFTPHFIEVHHVHTCELVQMVVMEDIVLTNELVTQFMSFDATVQKFKLNKLE